MQPRAQGQACLVGPIGIEWDKRWRMREVVKRNNTVPCSRMNRQLLWNEARILHSSSDSLRRFLRTHEWVLLRRHLPIWTRPLAPGKMICAPKVHSQKRYHLEKMGDYTAIHPVYKDTTNCILFRFPRFLRIWSFFEQVTGSNIWKKVNWYFPAPWIGGDLQSFSKKRLRRF